MRCAHFGGAGSSTELDALLGGGASNSTVNVTVAPSIVAGTAQNTPKGFDKFTPDYQGSSGASQVCFILKFFFRHAVPAKRGKVHLQTSCRCVCLTTIFPEIFHLQEGSLQNINIVC